MSIISIFSGSFCGGDAVADGVASQMRYERIDEQVLEHASERHGVLRSRLLRTIILGAPVWHPWRCGTPRISLAMLV